MANLKMQNSEEENPPLVKRKRVLAAVAQEFVTSEDDDNVTDAADICEIIENHTDQHKQLISGTLHALGKTIRNTLLEINEIREKNRERRHGELLEVLTKMVQHDCNTKIETSKPKQTSPNAVKQVKRTDKPLNTDEHIVENISTELLDEKQYCDFNQLENNGTNSSTIKVDIKAINNLTKEIPLTPVLKQSENSLKMLPIHLLSSKRTTSQTTSNVKRNIPVKPDEKEELRQMRAQMLELQRKKMEDRERKKRELLQMQNLL